MIKLEKVSKIYKVGGEPFYALRDADLEIKEGEMVAVQGRSGAGKSTLLHIIGCLDTFERGDYHFCGIDIKNQSRSSLAKIRNSRIGFVLQDFSLINHRTALYNAEAPMLFGNAPFFEMKKRARNALEIFGVLSQEKKKAVSMSGGQRQRVAIARAIVNDPDLILADEPPGNLDSSTAAEIMDIFVRLNNEGKTVIIVTHDDVIASYCQRRIVISDGTLSQ